MPFGGWACSYQTNIPNYSKMAIKVIYIDLFCGAGGTSTGVHFARHAGDPCAKVIACVNHDANAIASHAANHPDALHYTEDIRTLELGPLAAHAARMRRQYPDAFVVLWASLECTNFSRAKGGLPRDADSRTLAEHLFRYIEALNPDYIQIENVEEFMSWGDLDERSKPVSRDAGRLYRKWVDNVRGYGYDFGHRILNAADFGAYTSRRRFFGIFARRGLPIVFPKPTHTKNPAQGDLFGQQFRKWRPVREVLDLEDEGESIFDRKRPLVEASLARIHAGLVKFVAGGREAFLVKYNSMNQSGKYVAPGIDEPCPTVATQNRLGVAKVYYLCKHFGGSPEGKCTAVDAPAGAITCRDHHAFASAGTATDRPCFTLIARMDKRPPRLVTAEADGEALPSFIRLEDETLVYEIYPEDTPMLVQIKEFMALYGLVDIRMRMLRIPELKRIMGFPENYVLIGTQEEQKKFIGNAVEVNMARVLCEALVAKLYELNIVPQRFAA